MSSAKSNVNNQVDALLGAYLDTKECQAAKISSLYVINELIKVAEKYKVDAKQLASMRSNYVERLALGDAPDIFAASIEKKNNSKISNMELGDNFISNVERITKLRSAKLFARHFSGANESLLEYGRAKNGKKERRTSADVEKMVLEELRGDLARKTKFSRTYVVGQNNEVMRALASDERVLRIFGRASLSHMALADSALLDVFKEYTHNHRDEIQHVTHVRTQAEMDATGKKMKTLTYVMINRDTKDPVLRGVVEQLSKHQEIHEGVAKALAVMGHAVPNKVLSDELALSRMFLASLNQLGTNDKGEKLKEVVSGADAIDTAIVLMSSAFHDLVKKLNKKLNKNHKEGDRSKSPAVKSHTGSRAVSPNGNDEPKYVAPGQQGFRPKQAATTVPSFEGAGAATATGKGPRFGGGQPRSTNNSPTGGKKLFGQ